MAILFLDDNKERVTKFRKLMKNHHVVWYDSTKDLIKKMFEYTYGEDPLIKEIWLDHDMGKDSGMKVVDALIRDFTPWYFRNTTFVVHSVNPPAAKIMVERLRKSGYYVQRIPFTGFP